MFRVKSSPAGPPRLRLRRGEQHRLCSRIRTVRSSQEQAGAVCGNGRWPGEPKEGGRRGVATGVCCERHVGHNSRFPRGPVFTSSGTLTLRSTNEDTRDRSAPSAGKGASRTASTSASDRVGSDAPRAMAASWWSTPCHNGSPLQPRANPRPTQARGSVRCTAASVGQAGVPPACQPFETTSTHRLMGPPETTAVPVLLTRQEFGQGWISPRRDTGNRRCTPCPTCTVSCIEKNQIFWRF